MVASLPLLPLPPNGPEAPSVMVPSTVPVLVPVVEESASEVPEVSCSAQNAVAEKFQPVVVFGRRSSLSLPRRTMRQRLFQPLRLGEPMAERFLELSEFIVGDSHGQFFPFCRARYFAWDACCFAAAAFDLHAF